MVQLCDAQSRTLIVQTARQAGGRDFNELGPRRHRCRRKTAASRLV
jgi:hypothetical protein